jgi:hypothetical protein
MAAPLAEFVRCDKDGYDVGAVLPLYLNNTVFRAILAAGLEEMPCGNKG